MFVIFYGNMISLSESMDVKGSMLLRYGAFRGLVPVYCGHLWLISNPRSHKCQNQFCLLFHCSNPSCEMQSWHFVQRNRDDGCRVNEVRKLCSPTHPLTPITHFNSTRHLSNFFPVIFPFHDLRVVAVLTSVRRPLTAISLLHWLRSITLCCYFTLDIISIHLRNAIPCIQANAHCECHYCVQLFGLLIARSHAFCA
jgi:hypothetical protein